MYATHATVNIRSLMHERTYHFIWLDDTAAVVASSAAAAARSSNKFLFFPLPFFHLMRI